MAEIKSALLFGVTIHFNPHQADVSESLISQWEWGGGKFAPQRKLAILAIFLHSMQQKWDEGTLGRLRLTLIGSRTTLVLQWALPWPYNTPNRALHKLAIFLNSMQQKWDQGTLGTQRSNLIWSRTRLSPSMDPAMAL